MAAHEETLLLEEEFNIETRWTPDMPKYKEALVLIAERLGF